MHRDLTLARYNQGVWSGFRDPALPISERVLWRLTHSTPGKRAEARVWVMDQGRQLRVTVDGELVWSHQFARGDDPTELTTMSDDYRISLERRLDARPDDVTAPTMTCH